MSLWIQKYTELSWSSEERFYISTLSWFQYFIQPKWNENTIDRISNQKMRERRWIWKVKTYWQVKNKHSGSFFAINIERKWRISSLWWKLT